MRVRVPINFGGAPKNLKASLKILGELLKKLIASLKNLWQLTKILRQLIKNLGVHENFETAHKILREVLKI